MKKALSLVLSVAMLMTVALSMFVPSVSADTQWIELMNPDFIVEGSENVTVNDDGTWTVTGNFAMRCDVNYDLDTMFYLYQQLDTNTPVKITIFDEPNNHWIGLYDNWVGPSHFPAGTYKNNDGIKGIYTWNKWDYSNGANVTAVYFEFDGANADTVMTLSQFYLNDGFSIKPDEIYFGDAEYDYNTTVDLAVKDVDAWGTAPTNGSEVTMTATEDTLVLGNTAGAWPYAYMDFDEPIAITDETMIYADFSIAQGAKTTIYLFFGNASCHEFDSGAYAVVHNDFGAEIGFGNYSGYVSIADILPTDEAARAACYNADGELVVTGIKMFATSVGEEAIDPALTIRALDLCFVAKEDVEPEPDTKAGDLDGNGALNMMDVLALNNITSGKIQPTDAQKAAGDMDGNGALNMMDVLKLYNITSGKIVA